MNKVQFNPMTEFPKVSEDPDHSVFVIGYDEEGQSPYMTYYHFKDKEWYTMEPDSVKLICWMEIPNPKEFLNNKSWSSVENSGYR